MEVEDDIESWWSLVRGPEPPLSEFGDEGGAKPKLPRLLAAIFSAGSEGVWWVSLSDGQREAAPRVSSTVSVVGDALVFTPTTFPIHEAAVIMKAQIWTAQEGGDLMYESPLSTVMRVMTGDTAHLQLRVTLT